MKVHLSGVCGTAMASLAGLLKEAGHEVSGSDQDVYPPMSTQLQSLGIPVRSPYAAGNVAEDADLVVIGNALSRGNPEVEAVLDRKQAMTSMPALLAEEFIGKRTSLVVAGTHGKTTTTSLLAFLLAATGRDPSFLVGGVPVDFGRSYRLGGGGAFVVEGDEYDSAFFDKRPKFVHYRPDVAVLGNVEFDHADIYPDLDAVMAAFGRLLVMIPGRGLLVAGVESPGVRQLLEKAPCRIERFGVSVEADWRADESAPDGDGMGFRLTRRGRDEGRVVSPLPGLHNVRNLLAALAAAEAAGVSLEESRAVLSGFKGVRRRLELRGQARGVAVYDDFAHHPTAVTETIAALRGALPGRRIVAVFEPRSFTARSRVFQERFGAALASADEVVVSAVHRPGTVRPEERLSEAELVADVARRGVRARFFPSVDAILESLAPELREGDAVLVLSNGGFGSIHERLLAALAG